MLKIVIDGSPYEVTKGKNLLETSLSLGFDLPYFCWHPAMGSVGACRQCAIKKFKDEKDDHGKIVMACLEPVADELRISIDDPEAVRFRKQVVESLMTNHPHDCPTCDEGGECHLQDMTVMTGHNYRRYRFNKRTYRNQYLGPFLNHEMNRCIQCYRCVRFYKEYAGGTDLDVFASHNHVYFGRSEEGTLENPFSGNLVEVCPTGVFTDKTLHKHYTRKWDLTNAPSICHQCSLGCNIIGGERYGSLRRILSRYNGAVNGYFLCDRGRFGYEFVNGEDRIRVPFVQRNDTFEATDPGKALEKAAAMLLSSGKVIGIGSPRASVEANFALKKLVGAANFFAGTAPMEWTLTATAIDILTSLPVRTPSLKEMERSDAVFILGEDLTNTAPMMALALRQAVRQKQFDMAAPIGIPPWNDHAVREAAQGAKSPLFLLAPYETPLDDIARKVFRDHPDNLARLGFAIAAKIDKAAPAPNGLPAETEALAEEIAKTLTEADRPLIVSGSSMQHPSLVKAAGNIALALQQQYKEPWLSFVLPEANSAGLDLLGSRPLEEAFESGAETVIILENDLFRRAGTGVVKQFLSTTKVLLLDHIHSPTADEADLVLPAGTFAESDGTLINQEGRAQRFYQIYVPTDPICESWRWVGQIARAAGMEGWDNLLNLEDFIQAVAAIGPVFQEIDELAPPPGFRINGQAIAREPHRYSGRTAMNANRNINEPAPPDDPDSALRFSMEGYHGEPPAPLIPFFWSPGWNSAQAINKYQIEVGGPLHGGDPGKRLIRPSSTNGRYFDAIPDPWRKKTDAWPLMPVYHIFGSEETSSLAPAIRERMPEPYLLLNAEDAAGAEIAEGDPVRIELPGGPEELKVALSKSLPAGMAAFPYGLHKAPFARGIPEVYLSKVEA